MTVATCKARIRWTVDAILLATLLTLAIPGALENRVLAADAVDKMSLWQGQTQLRGANIWQSRMYGEIFRHQFGADMAERPRFTQADFDLYNNHRPRILSRSRCHP